MDFGTTKIYSLIASPKYTDGCYRTAKVIFRVFNCPAQQHDISSTDHFDNTRNPEFRIRCT